MINLTLQLGDGNIFDYLLIALMIFFLIFFTLTSRQQTKKEIIKKPEIKTELICIECGLKEIRGFKEGDIVSKVIDEKCKKCGGNLKIELIYSIEPLEERKIKTI
jgi:hypothetical protein